MIEEDKPQKLKCTRCLYTWIPRIKDPVSCPKCKQYIWGDGE